MKIKPLIILILLLLSSFSRAQTKEQVEKLEKEMIAEKIDTIKIRKLYMLSNYYLNSDIKKAKFYTEEFGTLAKKINYKKGIAFYYNAMAGNGLKEKDFTESYKNAMAAAALFLEMKNELDYLASIYAACTSLSGMRKYEQSLELASKALNSTDPNKNPKQRGLLYSEISGCYAITKEYDKAMTTVKKAYDLFEKIGFKIGIGDCLYQISSLYYHIEDVDNALLYAEKLLEVDKDINFYYRKIRDYRWMGMVLIAKKEYVKALKYLSIAHDDSKKRGLKEEVLKANLYIADAHYNLKDFQKAIDVSTESEKIIEKNDIRGYDIAYMKGICYLELKMNRESLENLNKAVAFLKRNPETKMKNSIRVYQALEKAHREEGQYKEALSYNEQKFQSQVEELEKRKNKEISDALGKYELDKKNKAIKNLSIQKQNETLKAERKQNQLFMTLGAIVLITIVLITVYSKFRSSKKNATILREKNNEIAAANEKLEVSLSEKELLLKEIHHRVKNNLQLVISLLSLQSDKFKSKELDEFLESGTGRILSMALIHENLYQTDNVAFIEFREYAESLIQSIIASMADEEYVSYTVKAEDITFDIQRAIPLGLILNELVVNTIKHNYKPGKDLVIDINLKEQGSRYEFTYKDPQSTMTSEDTKKSSFGLELIHLLAAQLDGESSLSFTNGLTAEISF